MFYLYIVEIQIVEKQKSRQITTILLREIIIVPFLYLDLPYDFQYTFI